MDRLALEQHLTLVERDIGLGEQPIARQHEIVAHLEQMGGDTADALQLLQRLEALQSLRIVDRKRLRAMIVDLSD